MKIKCNKLSKDQTDGEKSGHVSELILSVSMTYGHQWSQRKLLLSDAKQSHVMCRCSHASFDLLNNSKVNQ